MVLCIQAGSTMVVTARYYEIDGHMVTGLATINGAVYYFDDAGAMQTGIVEIGGVPYLLM